MIGIFDSGVGGLTVAREVKKYIPDAPLLYLGDTARVPYGSKSKKLIIQFSLEAVAFLVKKGARVIIIGCNTAAANAGDDIRKAFPDIHFYDVVRPTVERIVEETEYKKIGIIATEATIASHVYLRGIKKNTSKVELLEQACPLFVPLVEENRMHRPETYEVIESYLTTLRDAHIDALILGCTHYPYLKEDIAAFFAETGQHVSLIDTGSQVAQALTSDLKVNADLKKHVFSGAEDVFFLTDITDGRKALAQNLFEKEILFNKAQLV